MKNKSLIECTLFFFLLVKENWTTGVIREELARLDSLSKQIVDKQFIFKFYINYGK